MLSDEMREELVQGLTDIFRNNISMIIFMVQWPGAMQHGRAISILRLL